MVTKTYDPNEKVYVPSDSDAKNKMMQSDDLGLVQDPNNPGATTFQPTGDDPVTAIGDTISATRGYDQTRANEIAGLLDANASRRMNVATPQVGGVVAGEAPQPSQINVDDQLLDDIGFEDANASGIGIGNTDPTTREVTDEELVANQLEGLVSGDSRYIRNARMRAMETANARGQLGSSFAAGAAERAAIESALPIAQADAQAYRDVATQNMSALNNHALAMLNRATQIDTAVLSANTQRNMANLDAGVRTAIANLDAITKIDIANLDAETRVKLGNLQSQTQLAVQKMVGEQQAFLQSQQLTHETGMEQLRQEGRVELALLDNELQKDLAQFQIDGEIDLANLNHENRLELEEQLAQYDIDKVDRAERLERQTQHANLAMQAQINYTNYIAAYADTKMNKDAAARLRQDAWNKLQAELAMINSLYPEFDPILASNEEQNVPTGG